MPSTGPGSKWMSAIRCSYACTSGPWEPGPTTPPGTGGSAVHGGWMIVVGAGVVVVGAGAGGGVGAGAGVVARQGRLLVGLVARPQPAAGVAPDKNGPATHQA